MKYETKQSTIKVSFLINLYVGSHVAVLQTSRRYSISSPIRRNVFKVTITTVVKLLPPPSHVSHGFSLSRTCFSHISHMNKSTYVRSEHLGGRQVVCATYSSSSIRIPRFTACCSMAQPTVGTYQGVFYLSTVACRKKVLPHGDMEIHITHLLSECHLRTQTSCGSYAPYICNSLGD